MCGLGFFAPQDRDERIYAMSPHVARILPLIFSTSAMPLKLRKVPRQWVSVLAEIPSPSEIWTSGSFWPILVKIWWRFEERGMMAADLTDDDPEYHLGIVQEELRSNNGNIMQLEEAWGEDLQNPMYALKYARLARKEQLLLEERKIWAGDKSWLSCHSCHDNRHVVQIPLKVHYWRLMWV